MVTRRLDDYELLANWRSGDQTAGDALARRYYGGVLRFFEVRTRAADDLTQRTFLACVESREAIRRDASFRSFLFGIARHVLFRHLDDERRAERLASVDEPVVTATSLSVLVARREEHQTLLVALARLPEEAQTVIVLYYWEGMVAREIAYVLGVSVSTITTQLSRARHALETQLRRIARARVNETVSADLERWVRSLADPKAVEAIGPRLPRLTPRIWKG